MQSQSEKEQAEQLARQLRAVRTAVEASQRGQSPQVQLRDELKSQLAAVEAQREEINGQLQNPMVSGSNRTGLSRRIEQLDGRIAVLDAQIAEADAAVARAGGANFKTVAPPRGPRSASGDTPEEAVIALGAMFMLCVLLPLSIAYARRIWRRAGTIATGIPNEIAERLSRMDQNLDAIALEVERIGEGQRFLTRAHAEQVQGLPAGQAGRIATPELVKEWKPKGS